MGLAAKTYIPRRSDVWRKDMRQIVDGIKEHMNHRSDTHAAEFLGISRQHLHISITNNKLMPERLLEVCLQNDIDITRLLRDGRVSKLSEIDYSGSDVPLMIYKEGQVDSRSSKNIPKWLAEKIFSRSVGLTEVLGMIELKTDEMEPRIKEKSIVYLDTSDTKPVGGYFYLNVRGYGMIRRLLKANEPDKWFLTKSSEDGFMGEPITYERDFEIIGRCQFMMTKI